jgi:hypothetical protein
MIKADETRAKALINYLYGIVDNIINNDEYQIKADFLSDEINSYSIDKIPVNSTLERWITGQRKHIDTFTFRSRFTYSSDQADELKNVGFFELFEAKIEENNDKKVYPEIKGIEEIKCLNCGSLSYASQETCEMNIQIQITYTDTEKQEAGSY